MDVHFEKRLLRQSNGNVISTNGLPRASRNLFGGSPGSYGVGGAPSSVPSPTRNISPGGSVSRTHSTKQLTMAVWVFSPNSISTRYTAI